MLQYFLLAAVLVLFAACSGDGSIKPVSEKIQGPLGAYFEVVNKKYQAKNGKIFVEIRRINEGFPAPWQKGMEVGYSGGNFEPHFNIEFQNADGNVVSKDQTDIVFDRDELSAIADLGCDESSTVTFQCGEGVAQFKVGSTFKSHEGEIYIYNVSSSSEEEKTINLEGNIGKYPIMMTMHIDADGTVTGAYYYKSKGPGNYLYLKGEKSNDNIMLNEFTKKGKQTGSYAGTYNGCIYSGQFCAKSGTYEFELRPTEMQDIDLTGVDFDSFVGELAFIEESSEGADYSSYGNDSDGSSSGSKEWDELLDSYESYVTSYIRLLKKASNGDISAMAEYPKLMQKASDLYEKLEKNIDVMSVSQSARFLEITNKMTEAAQQMLDQNSAH